MSRLRWKMAVASSPSFWSLGAETMCERMSRDEKTSTWGGLSESDWRAAVERSTLLNLVALLTQSSTGLLSHSSSSHGKGISLLISWVLICIVDIDSIAGCCSNNTDCCVSRMKEACRIRRLVSRSVQNL